MADRKKPEWLTENADGSVTVKLQRGINVDGATVAAVTMREPTVADQLAAQDGRGSSAEQEVALIANLATLAPSDVKALTLRDYRRVQEALVGFTV